MTFFENTRTTWTIALTVLLLALGLFAASASSTIPAGPLGAVVAQADDDDDDGERRINRFAGNGRKACAAAVRRAGGGSCTRVIEDRDDRERYEVSVRRGSLRYEIELSRTFRVLDVDRDRVGDDNDDDDNDDD